MKTRIPSFSMMEIIVALAIGAVVLGISYSGYQIITKTGMKITKLRKSQLNIENALSIIYYDFYSSEDLTSSGNGLVFHDQSRNISYTEISHGVVRTQLNVSDTFYDINLLTQNEQLIINIANQEAIILDRPNSALSKLPPIEN